MVNTYDIEVCTDCILALANGEPFPEGAEGREKALADYEESVTDGGGHVAAGSEELGFSRSSCDGCGTTIAGDRHRAYEVYPAEEPAK